jgi:hypothetical protein
MGLLTRLWIATKTYKADGAATEDRIVLIVNVDGTDVLHHTLHGFSLDAQRNGTIQELDVRNRRIRTEDLTSSSFRLGIRGPDVWRPQHVFVWGEEDADLSTDHSASVVPLAGAFNLDEVLLRVLEVFRENSNLATTRRTFR